MAKPYIVCHMMMSADGRIDCAMTSKIRGVDEYYGTLRALEADSTVSGRTTAELEMALPGKFESKSGEPYGHSGFSRNRSAGGYEIVADSEGTLLWPDQVNAAKPLLVLTSEKVGKEYLDYLDSRRISWIACGKSKVDLVHAMDILTREFAVRRLAVVGGGTINGAFLDAGLLDEVSLLIGPAIDGRKGMASVFDGIAGDREPFGLTLKSLKQYGDGAVWLRYEVEK
ncbi:RibD family protein [Mesosutterella sp. AGMB02718]|uniref:RibD family protein n=1 Tax=Mesosutterella faecium TaxID=2925194 RepID=A0ABT7IQ44_9BURK|nr:RibD family protein [Mesosutterella sp. AGMB02718]MDL2060018.1 RibD family protein [Mesosutterella sp. AGMB02718]